jgi:uncharacterized protein YjdB
MSRMVTSWNFRSSSMMPYALFVVGLAAWALGTRGSTSAAQGPSLSSISVTPASPSLVAGKTQQFTAMGTYSDGSMKDLTATVTWSSSAESAATIGTASGLATGLAQGPTTITASSGVISGTAILTVTPPVPVLVSITIKPKNPSGPPVKTQQLEATGWYSDGSTKDLTDRATWNLSAPGVATVSPGPGPAGGLATGVAMGQATILATVLVSSDPIRGWILMTVDANANIAVTQVPQISVSLSPTLIQPVGGKLPASMNLGIFVADCDKKAIDLTGYSLFATGAGLSLSPPTVGNCTMTSKLSIDPSTTPGSFTIFLRDNNNNPVGSTHLTILDSTSGPIPSGLAPEVDAFYKVLSQSVCSDVFGKRVSRNFYCIEVKVGNNSGHPLQIAGIGFSNHVDWLPGNHAVIQANTAYASTRAVLLREEVHSGRNIAFHTLVAAGLIMGAMNPYFVEPTASKHFSTAASIVSGPLVAAFNIVAPDRVVGNLNNLDDESFRDSQVIPNNAQIRTMVFVEKRALTEELESVSATYINALGPGPNSESKSSTGKTNKDAAETARNGSDSSGNTEKRSTPALKNAQNEGKHTVENSMQQDNASLFSLLKFKLPRSGDHSPLLVKMALGNVVIVGDEIEYLQRVQVQGSPSSPTTPAVAVAINPTTASVNKGATQQFVPTVTGTANTSVTWAVNGIQLGNPTVGTVSSDGLYTAPGAAPDPNSITVTATSAADSTKSATANVTIH